MRFKIDWASLIVGRKFAVFALFYLYLRAISKYKPPGGLIFGRRRDLTKGFFALRVSGAYTWKGLFSEFYGNLLDTITKADVIITAYC